MGEMVENIILKIKLGMLVRSGLANLPNLILKKKFNYTLNKVGSNWIGRFLVEPVNSTELIKKLTYLN